MKQILLRTTFILSFIISSCSQGGLMKSPDLDTGNSHSIPLEKALENLSSFLSTVEPETKGATRIIQDVSTIKYSSIITKSDASQINCDDVLYVVNFKEDRGYALLAADDRIPEDILVITDNGYKNKSDFKYVDIPNDNNVILSDEPGVFLDENGDEIINPESFQLYGEDCDDFYVGNQYVLEDHTKANSSLMVGENAIRNKFIDRAVLKYTKESIKSYDDNEHLNSNVVTSVDIFDTVMVDKLLSPSYCWHQGVPYNDKCPNKGMGKNKHHAPVGCVPLSVAKIMFYAKIPNQFKYKDETVGITEDMNIENIATLCRYAGKECNALYASEWTFTFPVGAKNCLKRVGFPNVEYKDYSTDKVIKHLNKMQPLIIVSVPKLKALSYDLANSHGWIIDGYIQRTKNVTKNYYVNGVFQKTEKSSTSSYLVHCDFGWRSYCNGYFTSGIFNLGDSSENTIFDNPDDQGCVKTNYNWYLKTITYGHID